MREKRDNVVHLLLQLQAQVALNTPLAPSPAVARKPHINPTRNVAPGLCSVLPRPLRHELHQPEGQQQVRDEQREQAHRINDRVDNTC